MNNKLTKQEITALEYHENRIEKRLQTFLEAGESLCYIRDHKLYRIKFKTFQEYIKNRWDLSKSVGYQLIDLFEVNQKLSKTSAIADKLPETESQYRELAKLKKNPELMGEVWEAALAKAQEEQKQVTAKLIAEERKKREEVKNDYFQQIQKLREALKEPEYSFQHTNEELADLFDLPLGIVLRTVSDISNWRVMNNSLQTIVEKDKYIEELNSVIESQSLSLEDYQIREEELFEKEENLNTEIESAVNDKIEKQLKKERAFLNQEKQQIEAAKKQLEQELKQARKLKSEAELKVSESEKLTQWIDYLEGFTDNLNAHAEMIVKSTKFIQALPDLSVLKENQESIQSPKLATVIEGFWEASESYGMAIQKISLSLKKMEEQLRINPTIEVDHQ